MAATIEESLLKKPVQYLAGVGPKRAAALRRLEIRTLGDLLLHFPRTWEDRRPPQAQAGPQRRVEPALPDRSRVPQENLFTFPKTTLCAKVLQTRILPLKNRLQILRALLEYGETEIESVWFKRLSPRYDVFRSLRRQLQPGKLLWLVGRMERASRNRSILQVEEQYPAEDPEAVRIHVNRIVPIHPLSQGISAVRMRRWIRTALDAAKNDLPEPLPRSLIQKHRWLPYAEVLEQFHFPDSFADLENARNRLVYEELLLLEIALAKKREQIKEKQKQHRYEIRKHLLTPFKEGLGFEFTHSQKRAIREIFEDLRRPTPMGRLLQGDVGSGKTAVAAAAILLAVENGYQAALMAPTEILAEQHAATLKQIFRNLPVRTVLLTSGIPGAEKQKNLELLKSELAQVAVGTHAILESGVEIPKLAFAVIDEQHRFGVRQRALLRHKGHLPDILVMTATPIPRTLALALYGDLEVSTLTELPPGRLPIQTQHTGAQKAYQFLRAQVKRGRQGFIVYPLVEESDRLELKAAVEEAKKLQRDVFPDLKVELIHGQMPAQKKEAIMRKVTSGAADLLIATSIIEVGIDIPNATVMIIHHADRFGLATLHQLRGRIGRGPHPSTCFLITEGSLTESAQKRIEALCANHDGFKIGELDLNLRGPGEILGTAQHGMPELKLAGFQDAPWILKAREDAHQLLQRDPALAAPEHNTIRKTLAQRYRHTWSAIDLS
ncbi:MAG: ATP-dependent DNA helicase RecG [Elusimicrobia bacterium]|nr:ATP-dependent DNA helicase RecG [Elusimicrobiota bacterium]